MEFTGPPSIEQLTPFVPAKIPDVSAAFPLPRTVPDETGEPSELYHHQTQTADSQQLLHPQFETTPVKPPSPLPKPQPVYSDEVRMTILPVSAIKLFVCIVLMFFPFI